MKKWILVFAVLLTTTLTALWMAQTALMPVRRLSTAVKNVTQTDQLNPIRIYGRDDLGELTRSFNLMLKSLQTSREQQRQLIADAGHELRTPLTSMRTNIELLVADDKSGMLPEGARSEILDDVSADPFGNPIPPQTAEHPRPSADEVSVERIAGRETATAVVSRIGEPIQADTGLIAALEDAAIAAGAQVELRISAGGVRLVGASGDPVVLADDVARHLFVQR